MNSTTFVATCNTKTMVKGGNPAKSDVNGHLPIQLSVIAGRCPNRALVISGTVAKNLGIESGNTYVLQATYAGTSEKYGDNFNIQKLGQPELYELPKYVEAYGSPQVLETKEGKFVSGREEPEAKPQPEPQMTGENDQF